MWKVEIPPSKVPAKYFSKRMFVVRADKLVPLNMLSGNSSGSWIYSPQNVCGIAEKTRFSCSPCVPPPHEMLNGTPTCTSLWA